MRVIALLAGAPVQVYDWTLEHSAGVSSDAGKAAEGLLDALGSAPHGSEGSVRRVTPDGAGAYVVMEELARARRTEDGDIVWWPRS
ncbi:hypothetical protein [Actinomadura sp. 21ATH]|uniref:hypothetical protein n=1 Tax=Actinomadura sp. 21ATH TaxID=1735444 RepID=UPI0035BFA040